MNRCMWTTTRSQESCLRVNFEDEYMREFQTAFLAFIEAFVLHFVSIELTFCSLHFTIRKEAIERWVGNKRYREGTAHVIPRHVCKSNFRDRLAYCVKISNWESFLIVHRPPRLTGGGKERAFSARSTSWICTCWLN